MVYTVWSKKYIFGIKGDTQKRCRKLLTGVCDFIDVVVLKYHDHIYREYRLSQNSSDLVDN